MDMNPQRVRNAEFKTVRKGADPDEVRAFLGDVADELERAQNQSTAMEARARAAVARLQELSETAEAGPGTTAAAVPVVPVEATVDESETISRTLLLAQRTADTAVAEARSEAARIVAQANDEAAKTLDSTREMAAALLQEARDDAHQVGEAERISVAGEVEALKARRDFLESDVDHLESFLVDQRTRVREAASSLLDVTERVPGGLGDVRRPLLSGSDDDEANGSAPGAPPAADTDADGAVTGTDTAAAVAAGTPADDQPTDAADLDDGAGDEIEGSIGDPTPSDDTPPDGADDLLIVTEIDDDVSDTSTDDPSPHDRWADGGTDPTEAITRVIPTTEPDAGDEFRFSFDDDRS